MPTATATPREVNPLVVDPVVSRSSVEGALVVESIHDLSAAIGSGSWADAAITGAVTALDVTATVIDPVGSLIGCGLGWLIEHVEPLNGWLDDLAGDDAAVLALSQTWQNISGQLDGSADLLERSVRTDLADMTGEALAAYRAHAGGLSDELRAVAGSASTISGALQTCSTVVGVVRDVVRDALAQAVGTAISAALGLGLSLGTATPAVVAQVSTRVASLSARVGTTLTRLVESVRALVGLLRQLEEVLRALRPVRVSRAAEAGSVAAPGAVRGVGSSSLMNLVPSSRPVIDGIVVAPSSAGPREVMGPQTPIAPNSDAGTRRGIDGENDAAAFLARHGFMVEQSPAVPGPKNPDYRIEGVVFDAYTPDVGTPVRSIASTLAGKIESGQATSFVVNLDFSARPLDDVLEQFTRWPVVGLRQVLFVKDGRLFTHVERPRGQGDGTEESW